MSITLEDIQKYQLFLKFFEPKLTKFFEEQKPYIFCKEGCSHCCEKGEYPFSQIEFSYLMMGVRTLPLEMVAEIEKNVTQIKEDKKNHTEDTPFMHACPFLINKRCCLYQYRGIICRTHGLAFFSKAGKILVPACVDKGLNYSNVYDFENKTISDTKYEELGIEQEPLAHNVGLHFMTNNSFNESIKLDFGELKPMLDWFQI